MKQLNNGMSIEVFEEEIKKADAWLKTHDFDPLTREYINKRQRARKKYLQDMKDGRV